MVLCRGYKGELATSDSKRESSWQQGLGRKRVQRCEVPPQRGSAAPSGAPTHACVYVPADRADQT